MKHRWITWCLMLALLLSLLPAASAEGSAAPVYLESGCASVPKMTLGEMNAMLAGCDPNAYPAESNIYTIQPSIHAPYAAGVVRTDILQRGADRLSALRRLAGLPGVSLDAALCDNAQHGAILLAVSGFSHTPAKPADMDDAFYQTALSATSSSNLAWGYSFVAAIDGFMDDSDAGNISILGHRRWQLNPALGKVGFGLYGAYTVEKVFDASGSATDYEFISWPASGWFPASMLDSTQAWSVSLNPARYRTPDRDKVRVTLTRLSDGKSWQFDSSQPGSTSGKYFNVDTGGYGVPNCIIFRPDGITRYEGTYTVRIDGLQTANGADAPFQYAVRFSPDFSDVPENAYYSDAVHWALLCGVTTGASATRFDPNRGCTRGQVVTFLWRAHGSPEPETSETDFMDLNAGGYYYQAVLWAVENGVTAGTSATTFSPDKTCTRGQVVTFLWRAHGSPEPETSETDFMDLNAGGYYYQAVLWAVENGIAAGTSATTFSPGKTCTRAQVVTFLQRAMTGD